MAESQKVAVTIEDELRTSYLDYAMSVIIGRAIPRVEDGLKPVHRRVLYSMQELRVVWNQAHKKSARVVGEVLGKYHPHGDQSVYDALVRMAQTWSLRYPLVDGQGNFGSVDGDPPAAMRYTEVRMGRLASELLADLDKDTVDFGPNFDDSEREPLVLPTRFPNLLVNGSGGIAVGMATNIPPHNLREVIDATLRLIDNHELSATDLMLDEEGTGRLGVKGPDFPTAGFIYGTSGIRQAIETGRGRIVMRARATVEPIPHKNDREMIVVTELPYQVNKAELLKKIVELVREKRIEGISDMRDESDRDGMRMVVELKRDAPGQIVLNKLYQLTAMQSTFGVIQLAIVAGRPQVLNLKEMLEQFISHRREVVTRRTRFELREAESQREIVEGLGMAITETDVVIKTIRESPDTDTARTRLMALPLKGLEAFVRRAGRPDSEIEEAKARGDYFLSERQAKAILEMRLSRLTGLEGEKLAKEYGELADTIARLKAILASEKLLMEVISKELLDIRERYGDERRTEIVPAEGDISMEDLIADEDVVVTVSHAGYIKRVPVSEYREQGRGGRGSRGMETREEDFVVKLFVARSHSHILFFAENGKVYLKRVYEIPAGSRTARGRAIVNFVGMEAGERLAAVVPIREFVEGADLITCTRNGKVKRTSLEAYSNIRSTGIIGVAIEEGDALLSARIVKSGQNVLIGTAKGMSIRFDIDEVRPTGRDTMGVKGIELREGDRVVGVDVIEDDEQQVLTVSANGYGKRTPITEWRVQGRGGLGIIAMEMSERNGELVRLALTRADEQLMAVTDAGVVIRTRVAEIRETGRNTQGVRVIRVGENEKVVDAEPLAREEEVAVEEVAEGASEGASEDGTAEANGTAEASEPEDGGEPEAGDSN
ncbi:MAG: DNA gyrase subunit A [Polyangiales bacterium]